MSESGTVKENDEKLIQKGLRQDVKLLPNLGRCCLDILEKNTEFYRMGD